MTASREKTTDRKKIRNWIEECQGRPAVVKSTEKNGGGLLRVDFQEPDETLDEVSWGEFFEIFDSRNSRFCTRTRLALAKRAASISSLNAIKPAGLMSPRHDRIR